MVLPGGLVCVVATARDPSALTLAPFGALSFSLERERAKTKGEREAPNGEDGAELSWRTKFFIFFFDTLGCSCYS